MEDKEGTHILFTFTPFHFFLCTFHLMLYRGPIVEFITLIINLLELILIEENSITFLDWFKILVHHSSLEWFNHTRITRWLCHKDFKRERNFREKREEREILGFWKERIMYWNWVFCCIYNVWYLPIYNEIV